MGIESLKVQLTLNAENPRELEIIELCNNSGKRSGIPKQLLLAGYQALYGSAPAPPIEVKKAPATSTPDLNSLMAGG